LLPAPPTWTVNVSPGTTVSVAVTDAAEPPAPIARGCTSLEAVGLSGAFDELTEAGLSPPPPWPPSAVIVTEHTELGTTNEVTPGVVNC
jgi:hypothetical protein